jgi:hypothetical protein
LGRKTRKDIPFEGRSGWEPQVWKGLQAIRGKSKKFEIEYESEKLPYTIKHDYIPDFVLTFKDGRKIYIEAKGYFDAADRRKLLAVHKENPEADIRLVFMADNKIHKSSKMRYSDWCERHNFPFCIKAIPVEWFS